MKNQLQYNFIKNTTYTLKGLKDIIQHESSFKIEFIICIVLTPFILFDNLF